MEKWKNFLAVALVAAMSSVWAADANRATLSGDVSWSKISWDGGATFDPLLPVEFTLAKAVTLTFDASPTISSMTAKGGYRLTLVPSKVPVLDKISATADSEVAIQGGASSTKVITWGRDIEISGRLVTLGYLRMAASGDAITGSGTVRVETGSLGLRGCRWELNRDLTLEICGGATLAGTGDGFAAIDMCGIEKIGIVKGAGATAKITAPIRFRSDASGKSPMLTIAENVVLQLDSSVAEDGIFSSFDGWAVKVGGAGGLTLGDEAILPVSADGFCSGGVTGSGGLVYTADPSKSGVLDSLKVGTWSGTCTLRGITMTGFSPANFGNQSSWIAFAGCDCTFDAAPAYGPGITLEQTSEKYPFALKLKAPKGTSIQLDGLTGSGKLVVCDGGFRVFAPRSFVGSFEVEDGASGIVIGANSDEMAGCFGYGDGMISVLRGTSEIAADSTWKAARGILLCENAGLNDHGEIQGAMHGAGKVIYDGNVPVYKPEAAAAYTDANAWSGTVDFVTATMSGCDLSVGGNTNSTIILEGASGSLAPKTIASSVMLRGDGFKVTDAVDNTTVTFLALTGNGSLTVASGGIGPGSAYKLVDPLKFSGAINVTGSDGCSVVVGDTQREADGVMQFADGCTIRSKRNWTATRAIFGKSLYVDGECGDAVMKVTGSNVDFSGTKVHLVNDPIDSRRCYKLVFDASTKQLVIAETVSPPIVDVVGLDIVYGTDFTNAVVRISVTNFWKGYEFSGQAIARFRVYNPSGVLVGAGDVGIANDGTFDLGTINLPGGRGADFRYEVEVVAVDDAGSIIETVEAFSIGEPAAHDDSMWFSEDAATFAQGGVDGKWKYAPGTAFVTNDDSIAVRIFDDTEVVRFVPARDVTEDIVRVRTEVVFETAVTPSAIADPATGVCRIAGITLANSGDARVDLYSYMVWIPDEDDPAGGSFVSVSGDSAPTLGMTHVLEWSINYRTGYLTYSVDGGVMTNEDGVSSFRIPESFDRSGKTVCYSGAGLVNTLEGDLRNANLAAVVSGSETNQFDTVEDAVAASGDGDKVAILWDASWKPVVEDVGRTIEFDTTGHSLTVDAATTNQFASEGYCVVDLGNGNYRIDVITYYITFEINGGTEGTMMPQGFSVTNLVFELAKNRFKREGFDFANWNQFADGSGRTNWSDGAVIDMTPYGLVNMTLYAQWKVAQHCIIVEAADEFVYIELVTTNGVVNSGVRYFQGDATKATGKAEIPVLNGSDLVIRFSTDIEKRLTFEYVKATEAIVKDGTIRHKDLPQVYEEGVNTILDPIHEWAAARGITFSALSASMFSQSSFGLGLDTLLTSGSEVQITDFRVVDGGCSFKVTIDGRTIVDADKILPMIRLSDDLSSNVWRSPTVDEVVVGPDGEVTVFGAKFVKIVIPENS